MSNPHGETRAFKRKSHSCCPECAPSLILQNQAEDRHYIVTSAFDALQSFIFPKSSTTVANCVLRALADVGEVIFSTSKRSSGRTPGERGSFRWLVTFGKAIVCLTPTILVCDRSVFALANLRSRTTDGSRREEIGCNT